MKKKIIGALTALMLSTSVLCGYGCLPDNKEVLEYDADVQKGVDINVDNTYYGISSDGTIGVVDDRGWWVITPLTKNTARIIECIDGQTRYGDLDQLGYWYCYNQVYNAYNWVMKTGDGSAVSKNIVIN